MKSTGIVRKVDDLGRVVLPKEIRVAFDIKDLLEIHMESEYIMIKKYIDACVICGCEDDLLAFKEKNICKSCINGMK